MRCRHRRPGIGTAFAVAVAAIVVMATWPWTALIIVPLWLCGFFIGRRQ